MQITGEHLFPGTGVRVRVRVRGDSYYLRATKKNKCHWEVCDVTLAFSFFLLN